MKKRLINPVSALLKRLLPALVGVTALGAGMSHAQQTVSMWSHWPDEQSKRGFVEERVKAFEAATPQCKVNLQFIQKSDLYASVKTSVRTGQAPDIFWLEPDEIAFARSGFLEPLDSHINLANLEDWARQSWSVNGKVYGLPIEAYSVELYYNKELMKKVGVNPPASMQMSQAQFTDLIKKSVVAGITPVASGVGDRPFPGAYLLQEVLLRQLGMDDYRALLTGKLSFTDARVMEVMTWVKELVDAGAYPKSFSSLKLGESHYYFHTDPGAMMFPIASWYTGRAFVPADKGGQPQGFQLGLMPCRVPNALSAKHWLSAAAMSCIPAVKTKTVLVSFWDQLPQWKTAINGWNGCCCKPVCARILRASKVSMLNTSRTSKSAAPVLNFSSARLCTS